MAGDAQQRSEQVAWDRVGHFLEDMATLASRVWDRNLRVWNTVSNNIRGESYGADAMANDAATAMSAAVDNIDDIWTSLTRVPEREPVATALPTAFMVFPPQRRPAGENALPETVWIRVAPDVEDLPKQAEISVSGPEKGVDAVRASLTATLERGKGYRLEAYAKEDELLHPGVYDCIVYIPGTTPRPLANLRVVVEKSRDE